MIVAMDTKSNNYLDALRTQVVGQLASLLESQTRSQIYVSNISELIRNVHQEIAAHLKAVQDSDYSPYISAAANKMAADYARLDECFTLLFSERTKQWQVDKRYLQTLMQEFSATIDHLSETLLEKDLFERQNQALERIVLSHERVTNWKEFVQEILSDFHKTLPFNVFFIAFAEENEVSLFTFFLGAYPQEFYQQTRKMLTHCISAEFQLSAGMAFVYEDFILDGEAAPAAVGNMQLLNAAIPQHTPKIKGLLGLAFAPEKKLTFQEESIIRSILAVLVMVVGSSNVLSRTLSELEYNAIHDPLTGLHNRRHFNAMLEYELNRSERNRQQFSLLLLDIDNFKDINDTYGHAVGDDALCALSELLRNYGRKGDIATRLGGDEFAVILAEAGRNGALRVANAISNGLREKVFIAGEGKQFHVTVSIGVATYPHNANNVHDLLAGADYAMYNAKKIGKNTVCCLEEAGVAQHSRRSSPDRAEYLRGALREDRFLLHFQPIIDCSSGVIFAYEALARLREPNGNIIWAEGFIETLEKYGLAREFDRVVIDKAFSAKNACRLACCPLSATKMFINLSAQEIESRGILGYAEALCEGLGVSPESIVFEITERDAISDMEKMRVFITRLRDKGFGFALDDFGSGYNSFNYLRELRFDYAKIDGAFVRNILSSKIDYALVRNLFNLCRDMNIGIIAEYVENQEVLDALCAIGIDYAQGFHIGMPHPKMDCFLYSPSSWEGDYSGNRKCPLVSKIAS